MIHFLAISIHEKFLYKYLHTEVEIYSVRKLTLGLLTIVFKAKPMSPKS
jgi:hypothetical protein